VHAVPLDPVWQILHPMLEAKVRVELQLLNGARRGHLD
jgi:hypothetical protein